MHIPSIFIDYANEGLDKTDMDLYNYRYIKIII